MVKVKTNAIQNQSSNYEPIQALMPLAGGTEAVDAGAESAPVTSNVVRILAISGSPRIRFGATEITPTTADPLLIVDVPEYFSIKVGDVVAVLGGTIEVSNMDVN